MKRIPLNNSFAEFLYTSAGILFCGFALKSFLIPNHFFDGGVTGISLIVNKLFGIDLSLLIILFNLPILIINFFGSFKSLVLKTANRAAQC